MHRDIKHSNILINTKGEIKLHATWGLAGYLVDNQANTKVGTTAYLITRAYHLHWPVYVRV